MAKLVFGMNQSLDGYVDHLAFEPSPALFRHFIEEARGQAVPSLQPTTTISMFILGSKAHVSLR